MDFPIEEIEDENLYYKYVKNRDELIPFEKMIYRCEKQLEVHRRKMDAMGSKSVEWEWRNQICHNIIKRLDKWYKLNDKNKRS